MTMKFHSSIKVLKSIKVPKYENYAKTVNSFLAKPCKLAIDDREHDAKAENLFAGLGAGVVLRYGHGQGLGGRASDF